MIEKTVTIEELVSNHPQTIGFLLHRGIHCLACGEPVWGTLESYMRSKGFNDREIDALVAQLNEFIQRI